MTNQPSPLEQARTSHRGWTSVQVQGGLMLLTGVFIDVAESLNLESLLPTAVAIGGLAVIGWGQRRLGEVHEFMDANGIDHYDLIKDALTE